MLRIGEAAKIYEISNRTLRYWEEMGILKSTRAENEYRYYDDENTIRIKQIVLLRKLKMPIADIERVFITSDFSVAIDALRGHLENLKQDAGLYFSLITTVEELIRYVECLFQRIRPPIPMTSGHGFRRIRSAVPIASGQ